MNKCVLIFNVIIILKLHKYVDLKYMIVRKVWTLKLVTHIAYIETKENV